MYFSCALIPFNSSMVRLKATAITAVTTSVIFQFQYGTIKRGTPFAIVKENERLSIPVWYD